MSAPIGSPRKEFCKNGHNMSETRRNAGTNSFCGKCQVARHKNWALANPERFKASQRSSKLKVRFGINEESVGKLCEICGTLFPRARGFHLDHDHSTGKFRGTLCQGCNTGIGQLQESKEILLSAIAYLDLHKSNPPVRQLQSEAELQPSCH